MEGREEGPKKKLKISSCAVVKNMVKSDDHLLEKEDYIKHKKEMKEIVSKGGTFSAYGKFLLRQTYDNRQKEKDEMGEDVNVMQKIVKMAPIGRHVY